MSKSHWIAFSAYTVILLAASVIGAITTLPFWQIGLAAFLLIAVVGTVLSIKPRK